MRETPVFLGLTRPAKFFGLPIGYAIGLMFAALIPFVALDEWKFMLIIPVVYPVLWLIADRNPHLFEIMGSIYSKTPPTKNHALHGGDNYAPTYPAPNTATKENLGETVMKETPAAHHLPYLLGLTDEIIQTRQGDLIASAILGGIDSLTSEDMDADLQAEGFARVVGQLGEEFGFYINKVTIPAKPALTPVDHDKFSNLVDERWQSDIKRRKLQERVIVLTVAIRPSLASRVGFLSIFSQKKEDSAFRAEILERIERLNEAMRLLAGMHKENGFRRLTLSGGEWLGLLATINGQPFQKRFALPHQYLSAAMSSSDFTFKNKVVEITDGQNTRYGAMLGVHAYCASTTPDMLDKLELPYDIVVTNSFTPMRANATVEKMKLIRRQLKATEDAAVSDAEALEESADNVASGRQIYGSHHMSIMVMADSKEELETAVSEVWQAAQETGATLIRERSKFWALKGAFSTVFFGQAPANWSYRPRAVMISSNNFAEFAAFHGTAKGRSPEQSPWGENITVLPTVASSGYKFNFHDVGRKGEEPSPGHTLVLGRTGSGKTLGTAFLMAQARRAGARIIVFDKDQGLEMAIRAMGGAYSPIKVGEATGFNPFQTETDDRGIAWLTDWLTDLLARERQLTTVQTVALNDAVRQIASADAGLRSFQGLESLVTSTDDDGELLARVKEWTEKGRYGWLFSKEASQPINMSEEIVGIDMSEILDLNTERAAFLSYLFRRIERVIEDRKPTIIVIDEAWKMLDDEIFVKRLHDWLVTMRKKNCVVMMLTQTPGHLEKSVVGPIIAESVTTQILYPNNRASPEDYRILRVNENEAGFLCSGASGQRIALVRSGSDSVFVDFNLAGLGGALTVLGGGRTGEDKAPNNWRNNPEFWKEMV